jgi:hypothetical protein
VKKLTPQTRGRIETNITSMRISPKTPNVLDLANPVITMSVRNQAAMASLILRAKMMV